MSALAEWFAAWRIAEQPSISVVRRRWRELECVTAAVNVLRPFADKSSVVADVLSGVAAARRVLLVTPLSPTDPVAGLTDVIGRVERFLAERPGHAVCEQLQPLGGALCALEGSSSPVAVGVADVLSEYGVGAEGRPDVILVVPRRHWVQPVRAWLAGEELGCVDVAVPADLRTTPVGHRAVVLVGHPGMAFSSAFKPPEVALRELGWLLTAPAAPVVRVVLTADAPPLRADDLWLLPAGARPELVVHDDGPQQNSPVPHEWLVGFDAAPAVHRTPRPVASAPEDEALAVEVQMASGHTLFFHPEVGARPHVVAVDDETGAVALSAVPVAAATRGVVIAVRVGAAPRAQVAARADAWLARRRGWSTDRIVEVRGYAASLKAGLRRALEMRGHAELHAELTRTLSDDYARVLLHAPLDELYIAPQRRAGFKGLVEVIGAPELLGKFDDLATVRTAHRQAGDQIRRELVQLLSARAWVADVDEDGWAVLHAGELGSLLLAVVTARLDEPVVVARTWLGVLVDGAGRRVSALAGREGC